MLRRLLGSFPKIFGARARSFDMPERGPAARGRREAEALQGQRKQVLCFAGLCRGQRKQVSQLLTHSRSTRSRVLRRAVQRLSLLQCALASLSRQDAP